VGIALNSGAALIFTTPNGTTWTSVSGLPATTGLNGGMGIACPNAGGLLCAAVGSTFPSDQPVILVAVQGAAAQISNLITLVNSFNLSPKGIQTSFVSQLQTVQSDLAANNTAQACSDLTSLINHVNAQSGKHLTTDQANQLLAAAGRIQAALGC
jgi:hypothetical protein